MNKQILLHYLEGHREPLTSREGTVQIHKALCETAPDLYLHLLADPLADVSQKREMLVNLLGTQVERQSLLELLQQLPVTEMLSILTVIRDQRINRSKARELVLTGLLGHEQLPLLVANKRQRVAHLLRHVLGERSWSGIKRALARETPEGESWLQNEVLHYAWQGDQARLREVLCFLSGVPFTASLPDLVKILATHENVEEGQGLSLETLSGLRGIYYPKASLRKLRQMAAQPQERIHIDGPLTRIYRQAFTSGQGTARQVEDNVEGLLEAIGMLQLHKSTTGQNWPELTGSLDEAEHEAGIGQSLPVLDGRVAVVLDLSQSMQSSGERLYHPAALALAMARLLRTSISDVRLYQVGGMDSLETSALPEPGGVADIAQALLTAIQQNAQVVLLITDGYENLREGDTAQVVEGLRKLGYKTPIYQVAPVYALSRQPARSQLSENIPLLSVAHEGQLSEVLAHVLLAKADEQIADEELRQFHLLLTEKVK